jgi:hypothetical protein
MLQMSASTHPVAFLIARSQPAFRMLNHASQCGHFTSPSGDTSAFLSRGAPQWGHVYVPPGASAGSDDVRVCDETTPPIPPNPLIAEIPMTPPNPTNAMAMNDPKTRKKIGGEPKPSPADQRKTSTVTPTPAKTNPNSAWMNRAAGGSCVCSVMEDLHQSLEYNRNFPRAARHRAAIKHPRLYSECIAPDGLLELGSASPRSGFFFNTKGAFR